MAAAVCRRECKSFAMLPGVRGIGLRSFQSNGEPGAPDAEPAVPGALPAVVLLSVGLWEVTGAVGERSISIRLDKRAQTADIRADMKS